MFTEETTAKNTDLLQRRGVGKVLWRNVIDNLIYSEKEDLHDLAILRRLMAGNQEGQKLIAQMQERKTIRIVELNDLRHYRDTRVSQAKGNEAPADGIPDWLK